MAKVYKTVYYKVIKKEQTHYEIFLDFMRR